MLLETSGPAKLGSLSFERRPKGGTQEGYDGWGDPSLIARTLHLVLAGLGKWACLARKHMTDLSVASMIHLIPLKSR